MSGKVPPSSRAGKRVSARSDLGRAAAIFERFTGHDAMLIDEVDMPPLPEAVAVFGVLDSLCYTTVRDGRTEHYEHKFRAADKPMLAVSPDGRQLLIIGDRHRFTSRGIVDKSDKKNARVR